MSVNQRITELLKYKRLSNKYVADEMGVDPTTIGNFKKGKTSPSFDFLVWIKKELPELNLNWLIVEEGGQWLKEEDVGLDRKYVLQRLEKVEQESKEIRQMISLILDYIEKINNREGRVDEIKKK